MTVSTASPAPDDARHCAILAAMRFFNTTGPVRPGEHYCIAPLERLDLEEVLSLVRDQRCFVLHAPRQTGKTSALLALRDLLNGGAERAFSARDVEYVRDLGLVALDQPLRIANPIYAEVVPRELTRAAEEGLVQETAWYVDAGGGLDVVRLVGAFQAFFREHSEHRVARFDYREAGPQLLLQAFLHRIVNSGGRIEREYGLGRGRTDLLIVWPQGERVRRFVVECKVLRRSLERTVREGLVQTAAYMDRCAAEAGHLGIFDRGDGWWEEKVFHRVEPAGDGTDIHVWGM